jgi:hypothetical protein
MAALEEPRRRLPLLLPVVVVLLGTNAALGYGYLHYRGIAAKQEAAISRVESANADLQGALDNMRDKMQRSAQQLNLDNRELQGRLSALEHGITGLRPISPTTPPTTASRTEPPSRPPAATAPLSPSAIQGALLGSSSPANFTAPGWVPDYFGNESGVVTGAPQRPQRRSHHPASRNSNAARENGTG